MNNEECYRFEKHRYQEPIFNTSIDATYIIYLEGNGRLEAIKKQLSIYHPTHIVYIVYNKGYKKCTKELIQNTSVQDLNYTNIKIFKHAKENLYNNILVLEDDFIFSPKLKQHKHIDNINRFIVSNSDKPFMFQIGTVPLVLFPYNSYVYHTISMGTHACIYSMKYREKMMNVDYMNTNIIWDWDVLNNTYGNVLGKFTYYTPLCYQTFPMTDNRKTWDNFFMSTFITTLKLDTAYEPGTSYMYTLAGLIGFILFIIFLFIIFYILINTYTVIINSFIKSKRYKRG